MLMPEPRLDSMGHVSSTTQLRISPNSDSFTGLTKVLAEEVAPFNVPALTVVRGTFNTNMGNAAVLGKNPLPDDYKGSVAE
jgi:hypothetical protein